jgi:hypothetical protein
MFGLLVLGSSVCRPAVVVILLLLPSLGPTSCRPGLLLLLPSWGPASCSPGLLLLLPMPGMAGRVVSPELTVGATEGCCFRRCPKAQTLPAVEGIPTVVVGVVVVITGGIRWRTGG